MRAVVYDRYGPPEVQRLAVVARPVPKDDEVLIKVHATTVTRTDCGLRSAEYFISRFVTGLHRPKQQILGLEFAGEIAEAGAAVTEFAVDDRVFGAKGYGARSSSACARMRRWHGCQRA
jgi:NADPH:quinone reductase-like Zn-dependent oxidoreductase